MSPAAVTTITKIASLSTRVTGDFEDHAFLPLLSGGERMSSGVGELLSIIAPDGQRLCPALSSLVDTQSLPMLDMYCRTLSHGSASFADG